MALHKMLSDLTPYIIAAAATIMAFDHASQQFPSGEDADFPVITEPASNRAAKADRLPAGQDTTNKKPVVRAKAPVGCEPVVSILVGHRLDDLPAKRCIT